MRIVRKEGALLMKHRFALLALVLMIIPPAAGQAPGIKAGMLACTLAPSIGFIVGSRQTMTCQFTPDGPFPPEAYIGTITTIGLDIGITAGGALGWAVFAPTAGPPRGALAGEYVGATGEITAGVGVGANVLFGGSNRTIALQPVSVEGQAGVSLALGISGLELRPAP
jgi:Protein of unknown function (DUF992)